MGYRGVLQDDEALSQHEREAQLRDFDGIVGHITIVMSRYVFLAFEQRCHDDPRTLGSLFYACSEERQDLSLVEAMKRLLSLALEKVKLPESSPKMQCLPLLMQSWALICCKRERD